MGKNIIKMINRIKQDLIVKAQEKGIYENFGQTEIIALKDKVNYNTLKYGNQNEREQAELIDRLENWAMDYAMGRN